MTTKTGIGAPSFGNLMPSNSPPATGVPLNSPEPQGLTQPMQVPHAHLQSPPANAAQPTAGYRA